MQSASWCSYRGRELICQSSGCWDAATTCWWHNSKKQRAKLNVFTNFHGCSTSWTTAVDWPTGWAKLSTTSEESVDGLLFLLNIRFWSILVLSNLILHWELTSTSGWDICVFTGRSSGLQGPSGNCSNGQLTTVKTLRYRLIQSCAQWVQRLDFSQRRVTERRLELWFVDNGNASFSLSTVTGHQTINHKITNAWMLLYFSALILFFAFTQWGNINPTVSPLISAEYFLLDLSPLIASFGLRL